MKAGRRFWAIARRALKLGLGALVFAACVSVGAGNDDESNLDTGAIVSACQALAACCNQITSTGQKTTCQQTVANGDEGSCNSSLKYLKTNAYCK